VSAARRFLAPPFVSPEEGETMKRTILAALLLFLAASASAQTANTIRRTAGAAIPTATAADMAWLAGRWTGSGLGGWTEETWNPPAGGSMIGTFRLVKDDKPVFYEFMVIRETERGLALQLKHFNPDMKGWEQPEKYVEFLYVKSEGNRFYFEGLTFERTDDRHWMAFLAMRGKDESVKEFRFDMARAE
jgi:hypothetical protein